MNEYESKCLAEVMTHDQRTALEISEAASVPYTKIYQVLDSLEKQGHIVASLERPKRYSSSGAEGVLQGILAKKTDELKRLRKISREAIKQINVQRQTA